jgi:hypothetical protein
MTLPFKAKVIHIIKKAGAIFLTNCSSNLDPQRKAIKLIPNKAPSQRNHFRLVSVGFEETKQLRAATGINNMINITTPVNCFPAALLNPMDKPYNIMNTLKYGKRLPDA